jgi:hypothetical protein
MISPTYVGHGFTWPTDIDEPIGLGVHEGRLRVASKHVNASVSLSVRMLPRPSVVITGRISVSPFSVSSDFRDHSDADFTFANGSKVKLIIVHAREGDEFAFTAMPHDGVIQYGRKVAAVSISGAITNFYSLYERVGNSIARVVTLEGAGWTVAIRPGPSTKNVMKQLEDRGGYAMTHRFDVTKSDGSRLEAGGATSIIEALRLLLSFARGSLCGVGLTSALSSEQTVLWQQWGFSQTSRWSTTPNWFSSPQGQFLRGLFPGFVRELEGSQREHITSVIEMYAESNRDEPDVKPSLMLSQSALELLSWLELVENGAMSADGFKSLPAADRVRLLLHLCNIQASIPASLAPLTRAASGAKLDGPGVLCEIRNSLVHPGKKANQTLTPYVLGEAWLLSMWYLELALLNKFRYAGPYVNRLLVSAGTRPFVEPVPWADA